MDTGSNSLPSSLEAVTNSTPAQKQAARTDSNLFVGLLLLSGFCGISYEILYSRLLGNLVGDQMAVSSSILMTFLFGIGIGTRFAHRFWKHLWLIEAAIGYCGIAFALGTNFLDGFLYNSLAITGGGLGGSVFLCSVILSLPAFLIGCSLPLFAGYLSCLKSGNIFASAYSIYNFGAAITALLIEFWLLRTFGLRGALIGIASINILVSLILRYRFNSLRFTPPRFNQSFTFPRSDKIALVLVSIASAVYQLMMVKTAECLIGPFHETFALVLALVLLGIAIGSLVTARWKVGFGTVLAINLIGLIWFLAGLEISASFYASKYQWAATSYWGALLLKFSVLCLLMGVPAITFGATIPALLTKQNNVARESGELLFISSLANAVGFLLMAFVLHRAFDYGTIALIIIGMTGLAIIIKKQFQFRPVIITAALLIVAVTAHQKVWDENLLYLGHTAFHSTEDYEQSREELTLPEKYKGYRDVFAINWIDEKPYFFINGYLSIPLTSPSEKIVGAFSSVFAPRNDNALVLGVGSGATAGTVGKIFEHTDAVEINPAVLENLYRMKEYNFDIEQNPNVTIIQDDAIHFAKTTEQQYSLIINTVTTPLYFSSSKLYTNDFLSQIRKRLAPQGVYVTWIDSRIGEQGIDIILKTISKSFEHCAIGSVKSSYFLLLCSADPIQPRQSMIVSKTPVLNEYFLKEHDLNPAWLSYGLLANDAFKLIGDRSASVNSLDYPALEFAMTRLQKRGIHQFKKRLKAEMSLAGSSSVISKGQPWSPFHLLKHTEELLGNSSITRRWKGLVRNQYRHVERSLERADIDYYAAFSKAVHTADAHHKYGYHLMRNKRYKEAIQEFQIALELNPNRNNSHFNRGACFEKMGILKQALTEYQLEHKVDSDDEDVPYRLARVHFKLKQYSEALEKTETALRSSNNIKIHLLRGRILEDLERKDEAIDAYLNALTGDPDNKKVIREIRRLEGYPNT